MSEQAITPFLWFESKAEEAAKFYVDMFNRASRVREGTHGQAVSRAKSRVDGIARYDTASARASGQPEGSVMTVEFTLAGQEFVALNGGPHFKFSGAVSFVINCETQEEVDYFWGELLANGGEAGVCGWINRDRFGLTWQVVPLVLNHMLTDADQKKSARAMAAMLRMTKIDVAELRKAFEGK